MGIGNLIEEVAGAIAAQQAVEKVDPNAGVLVEGAAAIGGFLGAGKLSDMLTSHPAPAPVHASAPAPAAAPAASDDDIPPDPTLGPQPGDGTSV